MVRRRVILLVVVTYSSENVLRTFPVPHASGLRPSARARSGLRPALELGGEKGCSAPLAPARGRRSALRASLGFQGVIGVCAGTRGAAAPLEVRISLREILPIARPRSRAVGTF